MIGNHSWNDIYSAAVDPADTRTRIRLAAACCDSDRIPKVANAGGFVQANGTECQVMHNGVLVRRGGYFGEWMSQIIGLLRGHHEPQEEFAFNCVLAGMRPGAVMIEGGSFWSYYSLWFRKAIPDGRSIMIEPAADRLAVGKENFALNGYEGEFLRAYVGDAAQSAGDSPDGVPTVTMDGLLRRFSLERVHLAHMDIQGAELRMLRGSRNALRDRRIDFMFISTHRDDPLHIRCIEVLRSFDYEILCEHTMRDSFAFDGLIVARSPQAPQIPAIRISRRSAFSTELV